MSRDRVSDLPAMMTTDDPLEDTMSATLEDQVRGWARGLYAQEAAVELLIRAGTVYDGAPWLMVGHGLPGGDGLVAVDVDRLLVAEPGTWSSHERALVDIAASLLAGTPVDLRDAIASLDRQTLDAVLAAIAHAGGSHEHTGPEWDADDVLTGLVTLPTLHPWPA